ncbi:MAG: sulfite exporter TauE/SafE family protein [Nocardioides sp.]|nr:sulfite exporter TauE/SafE family protein [Nocardioides sp.]
MLVLAFAAVVLAAAGQAITGFGFVLVAVPLLTLLTGEPRTSVVACTTLGLVMTSFGWYEDRAAVEWRPITGISIGAAVGIPLGLVVFASLPVDALGLVIGVTVLFFTALLALRVRVPGGRPTQVAAGTVSGAMLATTGMNGPPLVLALHTTGLAPAAFRATLQAMFTLQAVVVVTAFAALGQFTATSAALIAVGVPALWLGWRLGDLVFDRLPPERARKLVLGTLAISGTLAVISALT